MYPDPLKKNREHLIRTLTEKYGKPHYGRNGAVFLSKHCVIKIPMHMRGDTDNHWEAWRHNTETHYARCKLININDVGCLLMERLEVINGHGTPNLPYWVDFIDCGQVGYDKKGRLKAYDFGIE